MIALDPLERVKVVKITDFDISKALFEGAAAMTCAGTTIYMVLSSFSRSLFLLSFTDFYYLKGSRSVFGETVLDRGRCVVVRHDDD